MLETYQGILCDNRIEWSGEAPRHLPPHQGVRVYVTLLDAVPNGGGESQGCRMAAALEKLAAMQRVSAIPDPAAWEREQRQDRPLPGRDAE
jgi:hypothetical protein